MRNIIIDLISTEEPLDYSQFTMDWIEEVRAGWEGDGDTTEHLCPDALAYEVENILAVIRTDIPDFAFFEQVRDWIQTVTA